MYLPCQTASLKQQTTHVNSFIYTVHNSHSLHFSQINARILHRNPLDVWLCNSLFIDSLSLSSMLLFSLSNLPPKILHCLSILSPFSMSLFLELFCSFIAHCSPSLLTSFSNFSEIGIELGLGTGLYPALYLNPLE